MSKSIDQQVVEMRFDNKQFESNVQTSMSTIEKLKQKLNFTGAAKGLEDINASVKKVDMNGLGTAVDGVKVKFSALEVMAVTALANITNSALNAGKNIVSALTIDPIKMGFQEYETQINAVQTILANTSHSGTTLEQVNGILDELNKYADMTIYNFTEMTKNIGTFTAAGVGLEDSAEAIKGIANLAAMSGSTSVQASTAMYQLSQALAAGTVSLQDWNSVVNAGMGGKVFQDALVRTAAAMKGVSEETFRTQNITGSFRESISSKDGTAWLDADVLLNTLRQFTGDLSAAELKAQGFTDDQIVNIQKLAETANDAATKVKTFTQLWDTLKESAQSGWTQTWEILVGDFEEAKELLTELSDIFSGIIGSSAESRNALLYDAMTSNWKKLSDEITGAGLSVDDFKTKVTEIAKSKGIDIDAIIEDYGSLEKAFKNGALSSDLLDQALKKMTGSSSEISKKMKDLGLGLENNRKNFLSLRNAGVEYSKAQDILSKDTQGQVIALNDLTDAQLKNIGYTDEQISSIRELSKTAELAGGSVKDLIDNIAVPSGRELLIDSLRVTIHSLIDIFREVGRAWRDVFPPTTADQLYSIIKSLQEFVLAIRPSEEILDKLHRTFRGLFSILGIVSQAISAVVSAIVPLFSGLGNLGSGVLGVTASFGDWLFNLNEVIKQTGFFKKVLEPIIAVIELLGAAIKSFIETAKDYLANFEFPGLEIFHSFLEKVHERMSEVGEAAGDMKSGVVAAIDVMGESLANSKFVAALQTLWEGVKTVFGGIVDILGGFAGQIADAIGSADFDRVLDILNTTAFGGIAIAISKFFKNLGEPIDGISGILEGVTGILDGVKGSLEAYQSSLKADTLIKIASAIGILAASILVIATIDSEKLSASLGAVTVLFANLMGSMALFGRISGTVVGVFKTTYAMIALSTAVLIMASALKKISDLDFKQLSVGLIGIITLSATMVAASKLLGSGSATVIKGAAQMVIFAAAIKVLASACKDLSSLSWEELAKGLLGVGTLLAAVSLFLNTAKFSGKSITTAAGIVILSAAIKILGSACEDFAQMDWNGIAKGLTAIGGLLMELALFTKLTGNASHVISTGIALVAIGAAMKILASATKDFSEMEWSEIGRGLTAMAGALLSIAFAVNLMPKNMIGIGMGLVIVSSSLLILGQSLERFGGMSWEEIAKGLIMLGGSMGILAIGLNAMKGTLAGSAAMLVASAALAVLTPVLSILGAMSWESIAKGLVAIAGAFTVLGLAGLVLTPLVPVILSLSGALALIGVSVLGIGAGLLAAGAGLAALAVGITSLAAALAGGATVIAAGLVGIITGIASAIPAVIKSLGEGIIELIKVIGNGASTIGEAVKSIVLSIVDVLVECVPALAEGALELISGVLDALVDYTPRILDSIFDFLIALIGGIADRLPELIKVAVDLFVAFFSGIIDALSGIDTDTLLNAILGIGLLSGIMLALSAVASLVPGAMVGVLGLGAIVAELALVLAAIGILAQLPGLDWLINEGGQLLQGIGTAIGSFIGGIVGGIAGGITSQFPKIGDDLSAFMENIQPFIEGAKGIDPSVLDGVNTLAKTILLLTGANLLDSLTSWITGGSSLSKFAEDLIPFGKAMMEFSLEITGMDSNLVANSAIAGKALAEMASTIPNSGGLVGFFVGENDMDKFGAQLVPFGKVMKDYSLAIAGMDVNAVVSSATAGKVLTELAATVPNTGGLISFFSGDNDLATFGAQLVPFGKAIKEYSLAVTGLDAEAVTNSTIAGKALVELSNTIPNTGGLISLFTGDNNMAMFGDQLVLFGQDFKMYSDYMKDVDANVVTTTSNAAQSLVTLAESLPENKLFTNETWLDEFGEQLSKFGYYFSSYYNYVSPIDTYKLFSVVSEVSRLIDLAKDMSTVDTKSMSAFGKALTNIGKEGVDGFISAFTNANQRVSQAVTDMLTAFINAANAKKTEVTVTFVTMIDGILVAIKAKYIEFNTAGQDIMVQMIAGVKVKEFEFTNIFAILLNAALTNIRNRYREFYSVGQELMVQLIAGIRSKESGLTGAFTNPISAALSAIQDYYNDFESAGRGLGEAFADGVAESISRIESEFESMMDAAQGAGGSFGGNIGGGSYGEMRVRSTPTGAETAVNGLSTAITSEPNPEPRIRPVFNLSSVEVGTRQLNTMFSRDQAMSVGASMNRAHEADNQNGETESTNSGDSFQFIQNNYSPKALSRVEIYRQTKNQFSAMERMVKA